MRPQLIDITPVSLLACLAIFLGIVLVIGIWLWRQRRRGAITSEQWVTAGISVLMAAGFLSLIRYLNQFRVNAYGAMLMLGFIGGTAVGIRLGKRRGIPAERIMDLGLVILIGAIIGARGLYLLITPNAGPFLDTHTLLTQGLGGLSFHGGLLGGLLAAAIYIVRAKLSFPRVADALAPGLALGYAITRIGCFLNGCCYGKHCDLPWAVTFLHSPDGIVSHVHPTQIYASFMGFAMCGILLWLSRGNSLGRAGRLFMVFLVLEGIERFVMEIFRQPDPAFHGILTTAQIASIVLALVGVLGWFLVPDRPAVITTAPVAGKPAVK